MSEITRGIMEMPYELAMQSELSRRQFWNCAREIWQKSQAATPPAAQVQGQDFEEVRREIVAHLVGLELSLMVYLLRDLRAAEASTPISTFAEEIENRLAGYEKAKADALSVNPPHTLAAQVQGERPEVVAWRSENGSYTEDRQVAEQRNAHREDPYLPLMTVAQHQRIVAGLELKLCTSDYAYDSSMDEIRRLVRELDVLLNGEAGAAKQASLCDLVGQVASVVRAKGAPLLSPARVEDERDACERWIRQQIGMPARIPMDWDGPFNRYTWAAWSARAALSAPPAAVPAELTNVRCMCGDEYPHNSYGAGFIAGFGMCENCAAAQGAMRDADRKAMDELRAMSFEELLKLSEGKAPPAAGVPEGWKLVPAAITSQMEDAYDQKCQADKAYNPGLYLPAYDALLAAAPTPPASEQQQAVVLPERREHPSMSMYAGFKEYATAYGEVSGHNDCLDQIERLNPHLAGVNQGVTTGAPAQGDAQ